MTRDSELAPVIRRFPDWECWRGVSGLFYARLRGTQDDPVRGESVEDLADQIAREEGLREDRQVDPDAALAEVRGLSRSMRPAGSMGTAPHAWRS